MADFLDGQVMVYNVSADKGGKRLVSNGNFFSRVSAEQMAIEYLSKPTLFDELYFIQDSGDRKAVAKVSLKVRVEEL